jgi:hypothetical protein
MLRKKLINEIQSNGMPPPKASAFNERRKSSSIFILTLVQQKSH